MRIGLTFSPADAVYRGLAWQPAFQQLLDLAPALVRIGAYWSEIEATQATFDFTTLDWLLDRVQERQVQVVVSVGMKAPRWPEFYLPGWLAGAPSSPEVQARTLELITRVVEHVCERTPIGVWQVENEPLDPSGPNNWSISPEFLAEEVSLVRSLDTHHRPVLINTFIDSQPSALLPGPRGLLAARVTTALGLADILGLDVYPGRTVRVLNRDFSVRWPEVFWSPTLSRLRSLAHVTGKDVWITEAQAEPWMIGTTPPPGLWPGAVVTPDGAVGLVQTLESRGFESVLLWGAEHWLAERAINDDTWWTAIAPLFG